MALAESFCCPKTIIGRLRTLSTTSSWWKTKIVFHVAVQLCFYDFFSSLCFSYDFNVMSKIKSIIINACYSNVFSSEKTSYHVLSTNLRIFCNNKSNILSYCDKEIEAPWLKVTLHELNIFFASP